jgi:hypothetical protein
MAEQDSSPVTVLRVREGTGGTLPGGIVERVFTVVTSAPAEDLAIVATAVDPKKPELAIPAPGSPHPRFPEMVARPPTVYAIGIQLSGGELVASRSCFHNVVVRYPAALLPPAAKKGVTP